MEERIIDLLLQYEVCNIEASGFMNITPSLVRFRLNGLKRDHAGKTLRLNKIIAKVSRPEVAEAFLSPAPARIVNQLLSESKITSEQADLSATIPVAEDLCITADSGGHTTGGSAYALFPVIAQLRNDMAQKYKYSRKNPGRVAGGIGTPEAAAAAFVMGADFLYLTGSINQCTVEAGTTHRVKDLLQQVNVQDTEYVPAEDMFEFGMKAQVLKKGLLFPVRANKLYNVYQQYDSLSEIDGKTENSNPGKIF